MAATHQGPDEGTAGHAAASVAGEATLVEAMPATMLPGVALGGVPGQLRIPELELVKQQFRSVTPENIMKPEPIHPEEDRYHFAPSDAFVAFFGPTGLNYKIVGHTLVWHQQCPDWFFQSRGDHSTPDSVGSADAAAVLARPESHIREVVSRYRGRIAAWDVANEAVADDAPGLRQTPWLQAPGEGFIEHAFRSAHDADPNAELYYNDFNIEQPAKRASTLDLLRRLTAAGARLDAVGIQGHWQLDRVPFDDIEQSIEAYAELGLKVAFTELDIDVVDRPDCDADVSQHKAYSVAEDVFRDGCPASVLEKQAEQYGQLFSIFARYADVVDRVTFWGLHDGNSWLNYWPGERTNHPTLFDRDLRPKPAFRRVIEALRPDAASASTASASASASASALEPHIPLKSPPPRKPQPTESNSNPPHGIPTSARR